MKTPIGQIRDLASRLSVSVDPSARHQLSALEKVIPLAEQIQAENERLREALRKIALSHDDWGRLNILSFKNIDEVIEVAFKALERSEDENK